MRLLGADLLHIGLACLRPRSNENDEDVMKAALAAITLFLILGTASAASADRRVVEFYLGFQRLGK